MARILDNHSIQALECLITRPDTGTRAFGALFAGLAGSHLGAPLTVALGASGCILGAAVFAWRLPHLRGKARQLIVAPGMLGGEPRRR